MFKALIAIDGSPTSDRALELAGSLLAGKSAEVEVLHVVPRHLIHGKGASVVDAHERDEPDAAQEHTGSHALLNKARRCLQDAGVDAAIATVLRRGDPADLILEAARSGDADLIVLGSRGLNAARRVLLGSVSTKVTTHAPCAVLVARAKPSAMEAVRAAETAGTAGTAPPPVVAPSHEEYLAEVKRLVDEHVEALAELLRASVGQITSAQDAAMWRNGHLITVVNGDRTIEFAVEAITDLSEAADPAREFPSSQARCTVRLPDGTSAQWLLHRIKFGDSAPPYTWMDEATTTPITREDIAVMLRPLFI